MGENKYCTGLIREPNRKPPSRWLLAMSYPGPSDVMNGRGRPSLSSLADQC